MPRAILRKMGWVSTPIGEYRGNGDGEKRRQYNRYRDWKVAPTPIVLALNPESVILNLIQNLFGAGLDFYSVGNYKCFIMYF